MDIFIKYLCVFATGGLVCSIGQILINKTKMTSARILVIFLLLGVLLEALDVFKYIQSFGNAGITIPITGFGSNLAKGAIKGSQEGLLQAIVGGMKAASSGLTAAIIFGLIFALICKSKSKKL